MDKVKLKLTKEQAVLLKPLRDAMAADKDGLFGSGMLVAQVFLFADDTGGAVVGYADHEKSDKFQELMGVPKGKLLSSHEVSKIREHFENL